MLDIDLIREKPEEVRKNIARRQDKEALENFDRVLKKDKIWREIKQKADHLRHRRNQISQKINKAKKLGESCSVLIKEAKEIVNELEKIEVEERKLQKEIKALLMKLPNLLHESVPSGKDEKSNKVVKKWGKPKKFNFNLKAHGELIEELGVGDFKQAAKVSGAGFVYVKGQLALLDLALQKFAIDFLTKKGYELVQPPLMLRRKAYEGAVPLDQFETVMYKIENEDIYLIATSEHSLTALHYNQILRKSELPKKYCGVSTNFRKEIGSHGVDTKGLFRMHQFNKVEQYIFCKPEDSWKMFNELLRNQEAIMQKLGIPYRIVTACTADTSYKDSKMSDIEAWFPREKTYKEITSCSNVLSYQAARSNIKYIDKKGNRNYVHTLNATGIATSRTMRAILENYQQKNGSIKIPSCLQKYTGFKVIKPK
jgi:seryl-tRNA synthetase